MSPVAVRMAGICRTFGITLANQDVDLLVEAGTVHAVVGENGAGKSTLLRILAGLERPDRGQVWIQDQRLHTPDPRLSARLGVGMVHQHFMLVDPLTVTENVVLGDEPTRWGGLDLGRARERVQRASQEHGLHVDPDATVGDLSVGERQRVEILKVLLRGARVLVLDEPTAVLSPPEADALLDRIRRFRDQGRTVILVTHKLDEVMAVADRVTVLRAGRKVADLDRAQTTARDLAHLMVGHDLEDSPGTPPAGQGTGPRLEVRDLVLEPGILQHLSFELGAGQILGVAGVMGNGQSQLLEVLAGLLPPTSGQVRLDGVDITRARPDQRIALGMAHIPEERGDRGLVPGMSVAENLGLGRWGIPSRAWGPERLDPRRMRRDGEEAVEAFGIRPPDVDLDVAWLSGGNAQKVVVARELRRAPKVLLAGQPTRGVDVGAVAAIHGHLLRCRSQGTAILLVSADLAEVQALADRILVLRRGRVVGSFLRGQATRETLGVCMMGAE